VSVDVARRVKAELRCHVTDALVEVPLVHDVIPRLSQQVLDDVDKLQSAAVRIDIGQFASYTIMSFAVYAK